jgi:hypothetical protein
MKKENIQLLISKVDNDPVEIHFVDGEVVIAKILSVSESEKDVIFRIVSTNRLLPQKKGVLRATFDEIDSVSEA